MRALRTILYASCAVISIAPIALSADGSVKYEPVPNTYTTPDEVKSRIGDLKFRDGFPTSDTVSKIYDYLDFARGVDTFMNGLPAVSQYAIRNGFRKAGVKDNDVLIFSELMDARSLFLTANNDTVYFWTFLDLSKGPLVVEAPKNVLGVMDDMWFRWIIDVGVSGPDRGEGGKYLILPPGYDGPLPEGGYFVARSRTNGVGFLARAFLENNNPKPAVDRIKGDLKIYPYVAGSFGSSVGAFLNGSGTLGALAEAKPARFVEGSGLSINTLPPNDLSFYEMLTSLVQEEPAEALDIEIGGQLAAVGIEKGKEFKPDDRMQKILSEAIATANAAARSISISGRPSEGFRYYENDPKSSWTNQLFVGGYEFTNPPPRISKDGVEQFPNAGARRLNVRASMFYVATGITPAMVMRLPKIGSQYIGTFVDAEGQLLDGSKTYKVVLPANIPAEKFWSFTLYDNQTRSMLQTDQRFPRAGSQNYPTPAAQSEEDGSTVIYFGPKKPEGIADGNWIQTVAGKGWWTILRFYSPLEPFFDKSWRPGEIVAVVE